MISVFLSSLTYYIPDCKKTLSLLRSIWVYLSLLRPIKSRTLFALKVNIEWKTDPAQVNFFRSVLQEKNKMAEHLFGSR